MTRDEIREVLKKQVNLISERSSEFCDADELATLSDALVKILGLTYSIYIF